MWNLCFGGFGCVYMVHWALKRGWRLDRSFSIIAISPAWGVGLVTTGEGYVARDGFACIFFEERDFGRN